MSSTTHYFLPALLAVGILTAGTGTLNAQTTQASHGFQQAQQAFKAGRYNQALKLVEVTAQQHPRSANVQQFRSLILFALGRYRESAGTAYQALSLGAGWNWQTLAGLYGEHPKRYHDQFKVLSEARQNFPDSVDNQFLVAYHSLMQGKLQQGHQALHTLKQRLPQDQLVLQLHTAVGKALQKK